MAASFNWAQSNGAGNVVTELGSTGNVWNFQTTDVATPGTYATNLITAGDASNTGNSREIWERGHWQGTFNTVSNLKYWQSVAFSPATGLTVKYACTATYATPTTNDTAVTTGQTNTTTIPTSTPGSANIGIGNSLTNVSDGVGRLAAAGYSDYIVLQLHIGTTAPTGDTSFATFTLQYDET